VHPLMIFQVFYSCVCLIPIVLSGPYRFIEKIITHIKNQVKNNFFNIIKLNLMIIN